MEQNLHELFVETFNGMELEDQVKVFNVYGKKHGQEIVGNNEEFLNERFNTPYDAVYVIEESCSYITSDEYAWQDEYGYPCSASSIIDMDIVDEDELADYFIEDHYLELHDIEAMQDFIDACIESEEEYEEEEEYDEDYVVGHS